MLSQYDDFVFAVVVRRLFVFEQVKYIRLETINQINGR